MRTDGLGPGALKFNMERHSFGAAPLALVSVAMSTKAWGEGKGGEGAHKGERLEKS